MRVAVPPGVTRVHVCVPKAWRGRADRPGPLAISAHKAQKNLFRLVVGGVRRRHCVDPALIDEREKVSITQVARRFLDPAPPLAGSLPDLSLTLDELDASLTSEFLYKPLVGIRFFSSQVVVKVDDGQREAALPGKLLHELQQQDGVRPPGNGYPDPLARREEFTAPHLERPAKVEW